MSIGKFRVRRTPYRIHERHGLYKPFPESIKGICQTAAQEWDERQDE